VHDFLTYATPGKQQPQMIELSRAIGSLCSEISQHTTEPQIEIECLAAPGLLAWCDSHALRQIMGNLISNALRVQKKRPGAGKLRIEAARSGPWVDITVEDAGPGVPAEQRERIFDCFFTTQSEGTGLGLPIARRLSEMNGGTLTLQPEASPLGGARFRLRLSSRPLRLPYD
jgi:signal transduction histidine kinase